MARPPHGSIHIGVPVAGKGPEAARVRKLRTLLVKTAAMANDLTTDANRGLVEWAEGLRDHLVAQEKMCKQILGERTRREDRVAGPRL